MEILKDYLETNIALCNKNNVIEIILGKSNSFPEEKSIKSEINFPSIFNTNIYTENNIKSLFKAIKNSDYKLHINNQKLKRFYYENSNIDAIIKNENQTIINHYSKNIEYIKTIQDLRFDFQIQKVFYYNDTTIINSNNFNHSEEIEELELTINNSLSIIIEKTLGYYCKVQIFKPININIILEILKIFPTSSYS